MEGMAGRRKLGGCRQQKGVVGNPIKTPLPPCAPPHLQPLLPPLKEMINFLGICETNQWVLVSDNASHHTKRQMPSQYESWMCPQAADLVRLVFSLWSSSPQTLISLPQGRSREGGKHGVPLFEQIFRLISISPCERHFPESSGILWLFGALFVVVIDAGRTPQKSQRCNRKFNRCYYTSEWVSQRKRERERKKKWGGGGWRGAQKVLAECLSANSQYWEQRTHVLLSHFPHKQLKQNKNKKKRGGGQVNL